MQKKQTISWRKQLHDVIYESNTRAGKVFDIALLLLIIFSIVIVVLDSVKSFNRQYAQLFYWLEWIFTALFTIEYILRLLSIGKPWRYVFSFLGLIDLLAIIPSYLSIFFAGAQSLLVLRALRLLRIFRIFKFPSTLFLTASLLSTSIMGTN